MNQKIDRLDHIPCQCGRLTLQAMRIVYFGEKCVILSKRNMGWDYVSVLVHPHSLDGDYADHTKNAFWVGDVLELRIQGWKR